MPARAKLYALCRRVRPLYAGARQSQSGKGTNALVCQPGRACLSSLHCEPGVPFIVAILMLLLLALASIEINSDSSLITDVCIHSIFP